MNDDVRELSPSSHKRMNDTYLECFVVPIAKCLGVHSRCEGSLLNLFRIVNGLIQSCWSTLIPSSHAHRSRLKAEHLFRQVGLAIV